MDKDAVLARLKEFRSRIPELKQKTVAHRDTADFKTWVNSVNKWLALGGGQTAREAETVEHLHFLCLRMRMQPGYDHDDQEYYQRDLDTADVQLASAIENLELHLPTKPPPVRDGGSSGPGKMTIIAQNVTFGDGNHVTVSNSVTLASVMEILEREVELKVQEPEQKGKVLRAIKEFTTNPTVTTILGQALPAIFKAYGGG